MDELISIIIPVYNVEKYLKKCIESVLKQTHTKLEIILINDGSTDTSGKICDEYAKKDNRIIVIHTTNKGVSNARNVGLNAANGTYVGFVDSDDYIDIHMFERLLNDIKQNNADIAVCGFYFVTEHSLKKSNIADYSECYSSAEAIKHMLLGKPFAGHLWNKLFKKNLIGKTRMLNNIYVYEDLLFVYSVMKNANNVCFSSKPYYYYFLRNNSACHKSVDYKAYSAQKACELIKENIMETYPSLIHNVEYTIISSNIMMLITLLNDENNYYSFLVRNNIKKNINLHSIRFCNYKEKIFVFCSIFSCRLLKILFKRYSLIKKGFMK